jgi:hypothetical protein
MDTLNNVISDETLVKMLTNYQLKYYDKTLAFLSAISRVYQPSEINMELNKRLGSLVIDEDPKLTNTYSLYIYIYNLVRIKPDAPIGAYECALLNIYAYNKLKRTSGFISNIGLGNDKIYGVGINTFASQFIIRKYFELAEECYDAFGIQIINQIIDVIGLEGFIDSYFNGGIEKLCVYLGSYTSAKRMIESLEKYYDLLNKSREGFAVDMQAIDDSKKKVHELLCEMRTLNQDTKDKTSTLSYNMKN